MNKIYKVTNCAFCPHVRHVNSEEYCTNHHILLTDRKIEREERFVLDENGNAIDNKFPEWCLLEDYNQ